MRHLPTNRERGALLEGEEKEGSGTLGVFLVPKLDMLAVVVSLVSFAAGPSRVYTFERDGR